MEFNINKIFFFFSLKKYKFTSKKIIRKEIAKGKKKIDNNNATPNSPSIIKNVFLEILFGFIEISFLKFICLN